MPSLDKFCERMRYWCDDADLGYDQIQRWNIYDGGECDCSSLVIHALQEAGFDTGDAYYTGNLSANLTARGWARLSPDISSAQPGDILLNDEQHVAAVISGYGWGATVGEAWLDENYGIYYGASGDQTGLETRTRNIYIYPWNCILRYEGDDMEAHEVWDYNYESTAPKGNMYNCVVDIHKNAQPNKVWEYNYNGIAPGGNMFNCLVDTHRKVEALEKAIEKIEIGGAAVDYDKLAEAVADKLAKRMAD